MSWPTADASEPSSPASAKLPRCLTCPMDCPEGGCLHPERRGVYPEGGSMPLVPTGVVPRLVDGGPLRPKVPASPEAFPNKRGEHIEQSMQAGANLGEAMRAADAAGLARPPRDLLGQALEALRADPLGPIVLRYWATLMHGHIQQGGRRYTAGQVATLRAEAERLAEEQPAPVPPYIRSPEEAHLAAWRLELLQELVNTVCGEVLEAFGFALLDMEAMRVGETAPDQAPVANLPRYERALQAVTMNMAQLLSSTLEPKR